ncbi:MAG TPA: hypothetical protein VE029_01100 [Rhizobacter sp.]|nr:hypothetical protein [Rhizobacter sp.]
MIKVSDPASIAIRRIAETGINRFLDMVMGAVQNKPVIGTTTDANFQANMCAFFGALTPAQLQALKVELLPEGPGALANKALVDVNARAALGALSIVSFPPVFGRETLLAANNEASLLGEVA